jgi:hypothetical protein
MRPRKGRQRARTLQEIAVSGSRTLNTSSLRPIKVMGIEMVGLGRSSLVLCQILFNSCYDVNHPTNQEMTSALRTVEFKLSSI